MASDRNNSLHVRYNLGIYWTLLKKYWVVFTLLFFSILIVEAAQTVDKLLFRVLIDRSTEFVANTLTAQVFLNILVAIALGYAGILALRIVARWCESHFLNTLEVKMIRDLKVRFFNHILHLSHGFHTSHKTGSLISRLVRGGSAVERMTDVLAFNAAPLLFQLVVVGLSLSFFDRTSMLVVFVTVLLFIGVSYVVQRIQQPFNIRANLAEDIEKAQVSDFFTNIDSIKYFGKEDLIKKKFARLTRETQEAYRKNWQFFRWLGSIQHLIIGLGTVGILFTPFIRFYHGEMSLGTLVFIFTAYGNLIDPMFGFVGGMRGFYRAMADFESLFQYARFENEIKDQPHSQPLKITEGSVEFRNITFAYHKRMLFRNFHLAIRQHQKIALVGYSGCGKTTLVKLLYRLYDPKEGAVLIDGKDIRRFQQESLRSELSIVPQDCVLFDDTIYHNIAFSKPGASRAEVMRAMKFAQLDVFVKNLPRKEQTIVGERGVKLSGGEKQRVSIARAILANKKILVLDEATSSLDSRTEHEIQRDLQNLMKGRTTIIIAHRLSTVMKADVIVVLDHGEIVQMGNHHELLKQQGLYKKFWSLQKGGYLKE